MDTCKHDWHFVHGTSDLKCRHCGEVTGTPTKGLYTMPETWGTGSEYFIKPTGQLQIANFKPNYNLTFHRVVDGVNGQEVGKFDFNGPEMVFEGDAAESAKVFVDWVARSFHGRLEEERAAEREACAQMCDEFGLSHAAEAIRHRGKA